MKANRHEQTTVEMMGGGVNSHGIDRDRAAE